MNTQAIIDTITGYYPSTQAIYLFGSCTGNSSRPDSDIDLALLLPFTLSPQVTDLAISPCRSALELLVKRDVDLVNARLVSTVFQKEIISGARIYCADTNGTDEFEMLTISFYQKLNDERSAILLEFFKSKRAYAV